MRSGEFTKTKSGKRIHPIGVGTWNIASHIDPTKIHEKYRGVAPLYGNEDKEIDAIRYSLTKGQNHIDCAEMYGGFYTDEVVGRALEGTERTDLFIADKLWKSSVAAGKVRMAVELMLEKLRTDYIDLLYIHYPWDDAPWKDAVSQIDELIDEGIVRGLGVSNFNVSDMKQVQSIARNPIVMNQVNYNVLNKQEADEVFRSFCDENGIAIVAYQPIKRKEVLQDPVIGDVARTHGATPAQIALAWLVAKNTLPIPKAVQKSHIDENLGALQIALSSEDISKLDSL